MIDLAYIDLVYMPMKTWPICLRRPGLYAYVDLAHMRNETRPVCLWRLGLQAHGVLVYMPIEAMQDDFEIRIEDHLEKGKRVQ